MPAVCDCFPELKSVTAAREARYRSDPGKPAVVAGDQGHLDRQSQRVRRDPQQRTAFHHQRAETCRRDRRRADAARISAVGGGRLLRRGVRVLCGQARRELRKLRGGGADEFRCARPHDAGRAAIELPEGDHRHRGEERCAAGEACRDRTAGTGWLPRHCDATRSGRGRDDANSDDRRARRSPEHRSSGD